MVGLAGKPLRFPLDVANPSRVTVTGDASISVLTVLFRSGWELAKAMELF